MAQATADREAADVEVAKFDNEVNHAASSVAKAEAAKKAAVEVFTAVAIRADELREAAIKAAMPVAQHLPALEAALPAAQKRVAELRHKAEKSGLDDFMSRVEEAEKRDSQAQANRKQSMCAPRGTQSLRAPRHTNLLGCAGTCSRVILRASSRRRTRTTMAQCVCARKAHAVGEPPARPSARLAAAGTLTSSSRQWTSSRQCSTRRT